METKAIGLRHQIQKIGELQDWSKVIYRWILVIGNTLATDKFEIQLYVSVLTGKRVIKVNGKIKYSDINTITKLDVKFEIDAWQQGRIMAAGNNFSLLVNEKLFQEIFDSNYYYQPPQQVKERVPSLTKIKSQTVFKPRDELVKIKPKEVSSQTNSVFNELKLLKAKQAQILRGTKNVPHVRKTISFKGPS